MGGAGFCISNTIPGDADIPGPETPLSDEAFGLRVKNKDLMAEKLPGTLPSSYRQYECVSQTLSHMFLHILTFPKLMYGHRIQNVVQLLSR